MTKITKLLKRAFVLIALFSIIILRSFGQEIRGIVRDSLTGESLIDATVSLKNAFAAYTTRTGLDGSFNFKNIQEGSYTQTIRFVGYDEVRFNVKVKKGEIVNNRIIQLRLNAQKLNEVIVSSGYNRESDNFARKSERSASNVMNIISAKAIEISPDITVGNVMQRAAGVSVVKNSSGDGHYAIIRGMADRYNYTTINGIKIPSPDEKTHSIPLDIFPADLLERLEVVKSLTPSMEGDAIGGVTNMVLKEAPKNLVYTLNGSVGYNNFFDDHTFTTFGHGGFSSKTPYQINGPGYQPQISQFSFRPLEYQTVNAPVNGYINGSIGKRITKKFGFLTAVSYQHIYKGSSSLFYPPGGQPQPTPVPNTPDFDPIQNRTYSNLQNRLGLHLKLNYDFNESNKLSFYTAYFQLDQTQHRYIDEGLSNYLHIDGQDNIHDRSLFERQIIWNNTLQGKHQITNKLSADWSLVYSQAQSKVPIWVDQQYVSTVAFDNTGKLTSESDYLLDLPFIFDFAKEIDRSAYLNAHYKLNQEWAFTVGGMYRHKTKNNIYESYQMAAFNQPYTNIQNAVFTRFNFVDTVDGQTYQATENITAYYGELKWQHKRWEAIGGLRAENTYHTYWSEESIYLPGKTGQYNYTDYLPSVNIKYKLTENKLLRASYFDGISRPNYFEYIPVIKSGDFFDSKGNDTIKHVQSHNADLRYEQYFGLEDYVMLGTFYKYIINPIEHGLVQVSTSDYVYTPQNFGNATNYGFEFVFTKHFRNFAINGNYSYTKSSITTTKNVFADDSTGHPVVYVSTQTRPLQGQSDHIANLSLLYKNIKHRIEAQVSWVYTGQRIEYVSAFKGLDYWQRATSQIDFSGSIKASKRITLFAKITNLTNNPTELELHTTAGGYYYNRNYPGQTSKNSIIVEHDVFNQSFIIGFRFK